MKSQILHLIAYVLVLPAISVSAAIRYVNVNSANPTPPYTDWATAATTIQDAVDAAVSGDQILVTNGVYQTGGRVVAGALTNRVAVNKPVTVQSVNGAAVTVIRGYKVPGTTNGNNAIRCVYLTNGASLSGFTVTNGATREVYVYDYPARESCGGGVWCESLNAVVSNCVLTGNSAYQFGGGANGGTLNNCTLSGNSARYGGGTSAGTFNNCTFTGNSASSSGGGVFFGTLNNCVLTGNSAYYGGGASGGTLNNCIVYYNTARIAGNNSDLSGEFNYSCTMPLPLGGVGNISAEPQLADLSHLSAGSPCRGAGNAGYATGLDIDGETWAHPPSIGCDEYHSGAITGPLSVSTQAAYTNLAVGFAVNFTAAVAGHATANRWDFGDGTVVSNRLFASHSWAAARDYSVVFQAYNDTYPDGVSATVTVHVVAQPVHYVALGSANPVAPYTSWVTAANSIQDAVDAASAPGALVLVANGVYQTGGRVVAGALTNRVAVNKPVRVQSANGAAVTVIQGFQIPGATNGDSAIRCAYLGNGAALVGFTFTNGATRSYDAGDDEQIGGGVACESASEVVSNCVFSGNRAEWSGGGASGGTLNNCVFRGNLANQGAGAYQSTLNKCTLTDNLTGSDGAGGGAAFCTVNNCTLTHNFAGFFGGGGATDSTVNNCALIGNSTTSQGGGAVNCTLNNCTLIGNSASYYGGGASGGTLNNCIVYYNNAPNGDNYSKISFANTALNYSCTTPLPPDGVGNISAEPQLADLTHLSTGSPCRASGSGVYATGLDVDGETWANPPSIGCDEYHPGAVTGPLSVSVRAAYTNVAVGFVVNFTAVIDGRATASRWEFGDGTVVSNRTDASHSWTVAGDYWVVFKAYNDTNSGGISATVIVRVVAQPVHYVALGSPNPVAPYTNWAAAATSIQEAVDAASVPGALVLVTNGVYQTGGRVALEEGANPNRVAVTKALVLRSVNGAAVTVIDGKGAARCVFLTDGAALVGFILTNGAALASPSSLTNDTLHEGSTGGGVRCESASAIVSDCVLTGNSSAGAGGGASGGTLYNCRLSGNSAYYGGGGAYRSTLYNCTLSGNLASGGGGASEGTLYNCILTTNSANEGGGASDTTLNNCTLLGNSATTSGGGATQCALNNCIVYYNSAPSGTNGDNYYYSRLSYSCTTPLPTNGIANFTNAPLFVNQAGGNLRLQSNSPCINAGSNASAPAGPDLDGNPRIVGGTVDIGAYEFQSPQSLISYAWLQQYNLPTDGSADVADMDGDGMNNWQEWRAGTNPTDALSVLRLLSPVPGASGLIVSWQSVSGRNYFLERGDHLGAQAPFLPIATDIVGQPGTTSFTDTNAVGAGPFFYRVSVQE